MTLQQSYPLTLYVDTLRSQLQEVLSNGIIPEDFLRDITERIGIVSFATGHENESDTWSLVTSLEIDTELAIQIPGIDQLKLILGAKPQSGSTNVIVNLAARYDGTLYVSLHDIDLILQIDGMGVLQSLEEDPAGAYTINGKKMIPSDGPLRIYTQGGCELSFSTDGQVSLVEPNAWSADVFCMPSVGLGIQVTGVRVRLNPDGPLPAALAAAGLPNDWVGVYFEEIDIAPAADSLVGSGIQQLQIDRLSLGRGGVSGELTGTWVPQLNPAGTEFIGVGSGKLGGIPFALRAVSIEVQQNAFVQSTIAGALIVPFFDNPLGVELGVTRAGGISAMISVWQPPAGANFQNGLVTLKKDGLFTLKLECIRVALDQGVFTIVVSGEFKPDVGDLEWPSFRVEELAIDSKGNVRLEGGWLPLPKQYTLSLYGFQLEISKLGFGSTADGHRWIGFNGGLKLVDGLPAGASVEGLRILWNPKANPLTSSISLTLDGVGVEYIVPNALSFKGSIAMTQPEKGMCRFDGNITLKIILSPAPNEKSIEIEGQLVIGYDSASDYAFFAIYLGVELPAGISLGSTGLALYGMAGLVGLNMEPKRAAGEAWYAIEPAPSWYHKAPVGVANLLKWQPRAGSLSLGAGITIGTLADNGDTFNGRLLLVLSLPGPIIMLEGRANILRKRTTLRDEPVFRSLAVIDGRESTFLVGLDAQYKYDEKNGSLIQLGGGAEAFFDFEDPTAWHLYLGIDEPRDRRIRANIFKNLFESNGYFMIDAHRLRTGAWVGCDKSWNFGPVYVSLGAWIEGNADLSFKPIYFKGSLWLHGAIEVKVFGFGFGLGADARIAAGVFDPFSIRAELSVWVDLPWPFKDVNKTIVLEWGPEPTPPLVPLPLQEIAMEHLKVTTSWPLPSGGTMPLLLPKADEIDNEGFWQGFWQGNIPSVPGDDFFPENAPVVPLDVRPHITFGRVIHDVAGVGEGTSSPVHPDDGGWEWIGNRASSEGAVGPVRMKLSLMEVAVERRTGNTWQILSSRKAPQFGTNIGKMFGSWAPVPQLPGGNSLTSTPASVANVKLWLWSTSPFDYTQRTGGDWEEWFTRQYPTYPCIDIPPDQEICCNFQGLPEGTAPGTSWSCPDHPEITFSWLAPPAPSVLLLDNKRLCFSGGSKALVSFRRNVKSARIFITAFEGNVYATALDAGHRPFQVYNAINGAIEIDDPRVRSALITATNGFCLGGTCIVVGLSDEERTEREEMQRGMIEGLAHWQADGEVLPPWSQLRLKLVTSLEVQTYDPLQNPNQTSTITQYAYFRTEGPPGVSQLTRPVNHPLPDQLPTGATDPPAFDSGLADLTRYVAQTIPPTVAEKSGEKPLLPRPVYCAYDVGVKFNDNYVDQMYAVAGRDLSLYLFDNNDRPARDAYGGLLVSSNRWSRQAALSLTRSEERWLRHLDATTCATIDWSMIARDKNLQSDGQVLAADTLYEARLMPLLLHDTFANYSLGAVTSVQSPLTGEPAGGWVVIDDGTPAGQWTVREEGNPSSRYIEQGISVSRGEAARVDAFPGGTFLLPGAHPGLVAIAPEQPLNWTDYCASVYVRSIGDNPIGLTARWSNGTGYLFYLDRLLNRRRFVRVDVGGATILAETLGGYQPGLDSHVALELIGEHLRAFVDGKLICDVQDNGYSKGEIALFASASPGATFRDVRVDDLRAAAPVVYRFKFTTSRFTDYIHHMHSFRDVIFIAPLLDLNGVPAAVAAAVDLAGPATSKAPEDAEIMAYEALAAKAIGTASHQLTDAFDVTRVEYDGQAIGLLIRTSEPINWQRTTLMLSMAAPQSLLPVASTGPRLIAVTFVANAAPTPVDESLTLLLDAATELTGWRIEWRVLPDSTNPNPPWQLWYKFDTEPLRVAGQRVRIFAGKGDLTPPIVTGEDHRFGEVPTDGFQPSFVGAGVDLRIIAPDNRDTYMRRFLPDLAYTITSVNILRGADGTGFILLRPSGAPAGSQLEAAEYRLRWEYRRDNTALDSSSIILSRNGDSSPEVAQIDIPWSSHNVGETLEPDWRRCKKCQCLFYGPAVSNSNCPAGGTHEKDDSNYGLMHSMDAVVGWESDWRLCNKCKSLHFGPGVLNSICPVGETHTVGNWNYSLMYSETSDPTRQRDWRWCVKCQVLYFDPNVVGSKCAAGGPHQKRAGNSANYSLVIVTV